MAARAEPGRLSAALELDRRRHDRAGLDVPSRRRLFMAFDGDEVTADPAVPVRELSEKELRTVQRAVYAEDVPGAAAEVIERLVEAQAAMRGATPSVGLGAWREGVLASTATLFRDPEASVALIDEVATLRAHRERGLARAVMAGAVRAATAWRADLVVVPVDPDDWPQLMYARMGFEAIGSGGGGV